MPARTTPRTYDLQAVLTYAKAKLLHDDDVGTIKDLSYTLHLAYKNAEQKSL